jgi:hypothetical protein
MRPGDFVYLNDREYTQVLEHFYQHIGVDEPVGGPEKSTASGATWEPTASAPDAGPSQREAPEAEAVEYVKYGRQKVLDALGALFQAADEEDICLYCGGMSHEMFDCKSADGAQSKSL